MTSRCKTDKTRQRQTWQQTLSSISSQWEIRHLVCSLDFSQSRICCKSEPHSSHLFRLFWVSPRLLLWLLVHFVNLGIHAVHALCPLSIEHSQLFLTGSTANTLNSVQRITPTGYYQRRWAHALTFCLGYDLLLCAAPSQTCHTVWSSTHTYLPCWWIQFKTNMSNW